MYSDEPQYVKSVEDGGVFIVGDYTIMHLDEDTDAERLASALGVEVRYSDF